MRGSTLLYLDIVALTPGALGDYAGRVIVLDLKW